MTADILPRSTVPGGEAEDRTTAGAAEFGVSFVIPVYNKRPFLPAVLAALKAQRGDFPREFIFIDDGSTDGSGEALTTLTVGWDDVLILRQPNSGPSIATNRGMAAARYRFIKLVDGDDVLLPGATQTLLELLTQHDTAVLAFGRGGSYRSPHEPLPAADDEHAEAHPERMIENPLAMLLRNTDLGPSNCLVRTCSVRAVGGCDERVFTQDYSLFLRLAVAGAFVSSEQLVMLGAAEAEGRVNDGGPQVLHDCNLALLHLVEEGELPATVVRVAVHRAVTRAWLWARRREQAGALSVWLALRVLAYLPLSSLRVALLRRSCGAFALSGHVRRMVLM